MFIFSKNSRKNSKTLKLPLRNRVFNHYKNDNMANTSIADVLAKAQFKPKKSMQRSSQASTDDGSSPTPRNGSTPTFDCDGGLHLSDSESDDDERVENIKRQLQEKKQIEDKSKSLQLMFDINKASGNQMDFSKVQNNLKQIEDAKKLLIDYSNRKVEKDSQNEIEFNIDELLAMGETADAPQATSSKSGTQSSKSKSKKKRKCRHGV